MKKTFELTDPKIKPERKVDAVKGEINKYIKRERKKTLPENFDFWDFSCSFGDSSDLKKDIHVSEISKHIDQTAARGQSTFYLELSAVPKKRNLKASKEADT